MACPSTGMTASRDSVAPPALPGTLRMSVCPHAGDAARKNSHRRARGPGTPHQLAKPWDLIVDEHRRGLGGHVPRTKPRPASGHDEILAGDDRGHDRVGDGFVSVRHDLRTGNPKPRALEKIDHRPTAHILTDTRRHAIADGDHMRATAYSFLFHVPERPPDFSSRRTVSR